MRRVVIPAFVLLLTVLLGHSAAQVPEFDFYPEFRTWWFAMPNRPSLDVVIERYRERLRAEGRAAAEIERRAELIRTRRTALEADFWDRVFTVDTPSYNTAPNAFLMQMLKGRKPGRSLDVGMGDGRNTLYLAQQGWDSHGFDPAGKAVAQAQQRAKALGLTLTTAVSLDRDFQFGTAQWDLILLSYMPVNEPARVMQALRPGGIVVFTGPAAWFPKHGLLKMFDDLHIRHYEEVMHTNDDFWRDGPTAILKFVAERPVK